MTIETISLTENRESITLISTSSKSDVTLNILTISNSGKLSRFNGVPKNRTGFEVEIHHNRVKIR